MSFYLDPNDATTFTSPALAADQIDLNQENASAALADAIASKSAFVTAIFNTKRQQPITVAVTAGTLSWDASDAAVGALTMAATNASFIGGAFVIAFNAWIGPIGGAISGTLNWGLLNNAKPDLLDAANFPPQFAPVITVFNTWLNAWWLAYADSGYQTAPTPTIPDESLSSSNAAVVAALNAWVSLQFAPNIIPDQQSTPNVGPPSIVDPLPFYWPPVGAAPVSLTGTDVATLFNAIYTRYISLQTTAATYNAALAAMTTVADVAAYDVTSAWAY